MVKVKICGITNEEDALFAVASGADILGFIFTPKSSRCVNLAAGKKIVAALPPFVFKCGVFMDQDKEEVLKTARALKLDILQFHGEETAAYCKAFKGEFKVIKVLFAHDRPFLNVMRKYDADAYLFDTPLKDKQAGQKVLATDVQIEIKKLIDDGERVIISSGLTIDNIGNIIKLHPYAVDVASGVEEFVGKKDKRLVETFIKRAKGCE